MEVETPIHLVETCSLLTPLRIEIFEDYMLLLRDIISYRKLPLLSKFFLKLGILYLQGDAGLVFSHSNGVRAEAV